MAENHPLQALFVNCQKVTNCIQTHLSNFIGHHSSSSHRHPPMGSFLSPSINHQTRTPPLIKFSSRCKCTTPWHHVPEGQHFGTIYERP
ncbi:hypothetical protein WN944_028673 [Citrus x changshan-huyou]|uniref:Uncharacterized protein n=1 Tax=Citrus x changshan-huyou TaxID=2935761 RepID=A0AAP0LR70_9ROSI